jgi:hypothetical protein
VTELLSEIAAASHAFPAIAADPRGTSSARRRDNDRL